jgi:uncharacterized protein (TIGR02453 family)
MMSHTTFTPTTISFLKDLKENNYKEWFEQNRPVYEEHLLKPLRQLAVDLDPVLKRIDARIETSPSIGKAVSRIYRDTRFSNDKSPYRTEAWLSFKRPAKIFGNVPEFFLYFTTEEYHIGMGFYSATPAFMTRLRGHISLEPEEFGAFLDKYEAQDRCALYGEEYKKKIPNELPERFQPWIQKRNFYVSRSGKIDELFFSKDLKKEMADIFVFNAELYGFLMECIGA